MKVYWVPSKPTCPLRVQMSDDGLVAALQVRDEEGFPFYWLLVTPQLARMLIDEQGMKVILDLPDGEILP